MSLPDRVYFRVLLVAHGLVAAACGVATQNDSDGIRLYVAGRPIAFDPSRSAQLREQARDMFYQCKTFQAVTGNEWTQDQLKQLWGSQQRGVYALLEGQGESGLPFAHLEGRDFTLLLGLDSEIGVGSVLTEHDGVLTLYIKCPGSEIMVLGCELLRQLTSRGKWPVCAAVEQP